MSVVGNRLQKLHDSIGRGRPYANGLLEAKRLLNDPTADYGEMHEMVVGCRELYGQRNRRTLREASENDSERKSIEANLVLFDDILRTLKLKADKQARQPKQEVVQPARPASPAKPARQDSPPATNMSNVLASRFKRSRAEPSRNGKRNITVDEENLLSAIGAVNEAVIGMRFVVLDKPVGESGAHRNRVTAILRSFQNERPLETRDLTDKLFKALQHNFKVWQREAESMLAKMQADAEKFHAKDRDKLRQEMIMVPNRFGITDKQVRRLMNILEVFITKSGGQESEEDEVEFGEED